MANAAGREIVHGIGRFRLFSLPHRSRSGDVAPPHKQRPNSMRLAERRRRPAIRIGREPLGGREHTLPTPGHRFSYVNIPPLYAVLLLATSSILIMARRPPGLTLVDLSLKHGGRFVPIRRSLS